MRVGFVGFGEAASSIALGLHEEGIVDIFCYDVAQDNPKFQDAFERSIRACNGRRMNNAASVCENVDLVIVAVPSNHALEAARSALDGVSEGLMYLDVTTATPLEKKDIATMVEQKGGRFADGAMMGALLKDKHQVPMLLSGSAAQAICDSLAPYHTRMEVVMGGPGVATGIKFMRSITAKGISCLLIESLQAAQHFGVEKTIVDSFLDSYGASFLNIINGYVSGAIIHAGRREHELQNVVDFLKSENLPYTMAEATRQKLQWLRDLNVKDNFPDTVPRNWQGILSEWKL